MIYEYIHGLVSWVANLDLLSQLAIFALIVFWIGLFGVFYLFMVDGGK